MLSNMLLRKPAAAATGITEVGYAVVTDGGTSINLTGIGLQPGDLVLYVAVTESGSVDLPTGWTNLYNGRITTYNYRAAVKLMGSTPDSTVIVKSSGTDGACIAVAYRGVNTTTPIDATMTVTANTVDPPAITTSTNNAIVVPAIAGGGSTAAPTAAPTGYINFHAVRNATSSANECVAMSNKIVPVANLENPGTYTATLSSKQAMTMAFRAA